MTRSSIPAELHPLSSAARPAGSRGPAGHPVGGGASTPPPPTIRGPRLWLGIDPGSRWTGLVLRAGNDLAGFTVVTRRADEDTGRGGQVGPRYVADVLAAADNLLTGHPRVHVAVEGVVAPNPHVRVTDPGPALGTAIVLGAVLGQWPDAVVVAPGGCGSNPLGTYPDALVTPGERRTTGWRTRVGTSDLRHARSAWDLAGYGPGLLRLREAMGR